MNGPPVVTLVSAVVGLVIGTAGFVLGVFNYLRDRPKVVVSLTWDMEPFGAVTSVFDPKRTWVVITVTNIGRRPIFVSHASLHVPGETKYLLANDGIEGVKLLESDPPRRYVFDQQKVRDSFSERWPSVRGCVLDNTGTHWHSSSYERATFIGLREWAKMNWKGGLFRLWIVTSVFWVALVAWHGYNQWVVPRQIAARETACANARAANPKLGNPFDCFGRAPSFADLIPTGPDVLTEVGVAATFPLGTLALWFAGVWVFVGFQRSSDQ